MKLVGLIVVDDGRARLANGRVRGQALERTANKPIVEHVLEALELAGVERGARRVHEPALESRSCMPQRAR
jgi:hypothetical protein